MVTEASHPRAYDAHVERGTPSEERLTFFFSDIEGSTRAAAALGERFPAALEAHRRASRAQFARYQGIEVSTAGDSFFAVFADPASALSAAVAIQRDGAADAEPATLRARIGLHTGRAMRIGDDYVGLDVHRAARIADAGHGGQILVSETTHEQLAGRLPASVALRDLGRHRLKDVGPERLWQVEGTGLPPGPFPPPRSLEAHPTNLPADTTPLVDRERERDEVRGLLGEERLVTVTGAGGVGKTRLAIAVARTLVPELADGVYYLDLAATTDVGTVISALIDLLGVHVNADEDAEQALLDRLRNRDLLVVLDTADRVGGLASLVAAVAAACPRVRVLVTSRSPLRIAAEREYALGALAVDAGVELYAVRARAVRPGFELDAATRSAVSRLVARLDALPLAIELAAARSRLLTPAALLDRLERRLPALGEGARDAPDRQRTLKATIAWSCDLLAPPEQAVFEQLSVLEGSFDLPAIEAIARPPDDADAASIVEALAERSLLVSAPDRGGEPRFRMLRPIREFALDALRAGGAEAPARERHATYWAEVVRREAAALDGDDALGAVERLDADEPNVRQALDWLLAVQPVAAAELVAGMSRYWRLRGRVDEGLGWLNRALAVVGEDAGRTRADLLFWLGAFEDDAGRSAEASPPMEAALALRRDLDDEPGVTRALNSLGAIARALGDLDRAEQLLAESIDRAEASGDRRGVAMSLSNLAMVATDRGRPELAAEYMVRSHAIDEQLGGAYLVVSTTNLATALIHAERIDEGLARLRDALPGIAEIEDPDLVVQALASLAEAASARAELGTSARLAMAADALATAEHRRLDALDRERLDELIDRAIAGSTPERIAALRAEATTVDVEAGLALARDALEGALRPNA